MGLIKNIINNRHERKLAKIEVQNKKQDVKMTLAEQGIDAKTSIFQGTGQIFETAVQGAASIFGKGGGVFGPGQTSAMGPLIIGVVAFVLIMLFTRNK